MVFILNLLRNIANLNTVIEKAVKKYSKEVKTKVFPKQRKLFIWKMKQLLQIRQNLKK